MRLFKRSTKEITEKPVPDKHILISNDSKYHDWKLLGTENKVQHYPDSPSYRWIEYLVECSICSEYRTITMNYAEFKSRTWTRMGCVRKFDGTFKKGDYVAPAEHPCGHYFVEYAGEGKAVVDGMGNCGSKIVSLETLKPWQGQPRRTDSVAETQHLIKT